MHITNAVEMPVNPAKKILGHSMVYHMLLIYYVFATSHIFSPGFLYIEASMYIKNM